jgi:DNA-binding CsgD family transcriptional regulator
MRGHGVIDAAGSGHEFVGRAAEVTALREAAAAVTRGRGGVVWVEGEPGIGKSTLIRQALSVSALAGCTVYSASADRLRQKFPLSVMLECLRVGGNASDPCRAEIARLLRGDYAGSLVPAGDAVTAASERLRELVERECAAGPVVVIVDDLQWADDASVAVWHRLARSAQALPLLVVGAARPIPRSDALAYARGAVRDTAGGSWLPLDRLPDDDVARLMTRLLGARPGPRLRSLAAQAAGSPLYVRELVDALRREGRLRLAGGVAEADGAAAGQEGPPPSLTAAIEDRLGFLSGSTLETLRHAALLGERFTVTDVAAVQGCAVRDLVSVIREAVAAGVLTASGTDLVFRHAVIREALVDGLPAGLRSGLHREAARALATADAQRIKVAAQLLAAASLAGDCAPDAWTIGWVAAEAPALVHRAPRLAAEVLDRVLPAAAGEDWEVLAEASARARLLLGHYDRAATIAARLIELTGDQPRRVRATWTFAYSLLRAAKHAEAAAQLKEALADQSTPPVWRARLEALNAMLLLAKCDDEAASAAGTALAAAEATGDRLAGGYALHVLFCALVRAGDAEGALARADEGLALLGEDPETADPRLLLLSDRLTVLSLLGRDVQADAKQLLALAGHAGNTRIGMVRWAIGQHLFLTGQWDDALAELRPLFEPGTGADDADLARAHGLAALIAAHRDDGAAVEAHLSAVDSLPGLHSRHGECLTYAARARAMRAERLAQPGEAMAALARLAEPDRLVTAVQRAGWSPFPEVARLAAAAGDVAGARRAAAACAAQVPRGPSRGPAGWAAAAASRCRGLADTDPGLAEEAVAAYRMLTAPLSLGHALEDLAVVRGIRGDLPAARAALREAVDIYTVLGARWDVVRADARTRSHGVRRRRSGTRRPASGWDALTPTEVTVAYLVAEGLSNPEIGERMFLSWRTVRFHVSAIMAKLGVSSRVQIAREAARSHPAHPGSPEAGRAEAGRAEARC